MMTLSKNWLIWQLRLLMSSQAFPEWSPVRTCRRTTSSATQQKQEMHKIIREYLITNPDVLREAFEALERQQQDGSNSRRNPAKSHQTERRYCCFDLETRTIVAMAISDRQNVTVVEFFDYNCGYCKRSLRRRDDAGRHRLLI